MVKLNRKRTSNRIDNSPGNNENPDRVTQQVSQTSKKRKISENPEEEQQIEQQAARISDAGIELGNSSLATASFLDNPRQQNGSKAGNSVSSRRKIKVHDKGQTQLVFRNGRLQMSTHKVSNELNSNQRAGSQK